MALDVLVRLAEQRTAKRASTLPALLLPEQDCSGRHAGVRPGPRQMCVRARVCVRVCVCEGRRKGEYSVYLEEGEAAGCVLLLLLLHTHPPQTGWRAQAPTRVHAWSVQGVAMRSSRDGFFHPPDQAARIEIDVPWEAPLGENTPLGCPASGMPRRRMRKMPYKMPCPHTATVFNLSAGSR